MHLSLALKPTQCGVLWEVTFVPCFSWFLDGSKSSSTKTILLWIFSSWNFQSSCFSECKQKGKMKIICNLTKNLKQELFFFRNCILCLLFVYNYFNLNCHIELNKEAICNIFYFNIFLFYYWSFVIPSINTICDSFQQR